MSLPSVRFFSCFGRGLCIRSYQHKMVNGHTEPWRKQRSTARSSFCSVVHAYTSTHDIVDPTDLRFLYVIVVAMSRTVLVVYPLIKELFVIWWHAFGTWEPMKTITWHWDLGAWDRMGCALIHVLSFSFLLTESHLLLQGNVWSLLDPWNLSEMSFS